MKCRKCDFDSGPYGLCPHHVSSLTLVDKLKMRDEIIKRVARMAATGPDADAVLDARLLVDMERQP